MLAWRNIMTQVFSKALDKAVKACIEARNPEECSRTLLAAADAVYTPLKPIDSGLGEARRIASRLASVIANAILALAKERGVEIYIKEAYEKLKEEGLEANVANTVKGILEEAGASIYEPARSKEARESMLSDLKTYFEPEPQEFKLRRRRVSKRPPNPLASLRRLIREVGRQDPLLARHIVEELRAFNLRV